jgi:hypothetical protein
LKERETDDRPPASAEGVVSQSDSVMSVSHRNKKRRYLMTLVEITYRYWSPSIGTMPRLINTYHNQPGQQILHHFRTIPSAVEVRRNRKPPSVLREQLIRGVMTVPRAIHDPTRYPRSLEICWDKR